MRRVSEVRILSSSLADLTDEELSRVNVLLAVRERTLLDAGTLSRMPNLELILQTGGHGYHIDTDHTTAHRIPVALGRRITAPKAAIPELTFALAVSALRQIPQAHASMVAGQWQPFLGRTLGGKTLGILGYGRHGTNVARIARAYGMEVLVWRRGSDEGDEQTRRVDLDELLATSDVVTIHLRLSEQSRGLLNAERLARMKPGSVLINTSRGAIVDEAALVSALRTGPLGSAGLDVYESEPLAPDSPLRSLPNVVLTPHIGWTVEEVFAEFAEIAADHLEQYLSGELPRVELLDSRAEVAGTAMGDIAGELPR